VKGLYFQELLEMMQDRFSEDIKNQVINASQLEKGKSFTSEGDFDPALFVRMVANFGHIIHLPYSATMRAYGRHLNKSLIRKYPALFKSNPDTFTFLKTFIENAVADLNSKNTGIQIPKLTFTTPEKNQLIIKYESDLPFADVAEGMILSTIDHYDEEITCVGYDLSNGLGNHRQFILTKRP
jgi:hypothetical protein